MAQVETSLAKESITPQKIAVDAATAAQMFSVGLRTWWRWNSAGLCPDGHRIGGRRLWQVSSLVLWAKLGFPGRSELKTLVSNMGETTNGRRSE